MARSLQIDLYNDNHSDYQRTSLYEVAFESDFQREKRRRTDIDAVVIRAFIGGHASVQVQPFLEALGKARSWWDPRYEKFPRVEFMNNDDLKRFGWHRDPRFLVDWLLESDIHYILNHIHQGNPQFNCAQLLQQCQRLYNHKGFPSGKQLKCPIFLQDKYSYISKCSEICIPTLRVAIKLSGEIDSILAFLLLHNSGNGWMVKAPFSTNSQETYPCPTRREVLNTLKAMAERLADRVPYLMVQPLLRNKKEYKMICLGGKIEYKVQKGSEQGKAFGDKRLIEAFALDAITILARNINECIVDFLIRIDIMELDCGRFVVNEFESFEAQYCGKCEYLTNMFLQKYWTHVLAMHAMECKYKI